MLLLSGRLGGRAFRSGVLAGQLRDDARRGEDTGAGLARTDVRVRVRHWNRQHRARPRHVGSREGADGECAAAATVQIGVHAAPGGDRPEARREVEDAALSRVLYDARPHAALAPEAVSTRHHRHRAAGSRDDPGRARRLPEADSRDGRPRHFLKEMTTARRKIRDADHCAVSCRTVLCHARQVAVRRRTVAVLASASPPHASPQSHAAVR